MSLRFQASCWLAFTALALFIFMPLTAMAADKAAAASEGFDGNPGDGYRLLGAVQPRHARDIKSSNFSVGAETMDRDFTIYANWKQHLGPLGAKKARLQSGWAKTEKEKGKYDWAWMDEIIPDMVQQGVEPWVCLCYGNPIYEGGGGTGLGATLIVGAEALAAWDRYVAAFVERYGKHVDEWEIWNEPKGGLGEPAVQYAKLVVRTAEVIRQRQPKSQIFFAAGGSFDVPYAQQVLEYLKQEGKLGLVNKVIYHPYSVNPDSSYKNALALRKIARSFAPHIDIFQGENGAPSREGSFGAIAKYDWTEQRQAKWALRRLLGDLGRDIPSSYFSICDMAYTSRTNYKGLLAINNDKTVNHVKQAYYAVQNMLTIFDGSLERIDELKAELAGGDEKSKFAVFGYRSAAGPFVTLWRSSDSPGARPEAERLTVTLEGLKFTEPVYVDLLSGKVYAVDAKQWSSRAAQCVFRNVAVYDAPIVIAERKAIPIK